MKFKESKPIYLQIADRICDEILQGQYKEEERIPSVREYAATVEVNANTVVRSFDYLQNQEIIYNKRGLGYFVKEGAVARIKENVKREFIANELPQFKAKAAMIGITKEELVELL
jgi:DNA-binding transcriptional regulator YhcF (GntR family)